MARVLVLGAGGELGQAVARAARAADGVAAAWAGLRPAGQGDDAGQGGRPDGERVEVDLGRDAGALEAARADFGALLDRLGATAVINCAVCKHDVAQDPAAVTDFIATRTVQVIGRACAERGVRLLQMSTDVVFDGASGAYAEDAPTSPLLHYGAAKVAMETGLLAIDGLDVSLLRTSLILTLEPSLEALLGANPRRSKCAHFCVSRSVAASQDGKQADFFSDEIRSVTLGSDLAAALVALACLPNDAFREGAAGVLNLVAPNAISRLDLANGLLEYYGPQLDAKGERPTVGSSLSREVFGGKRPLDCSLATKRYEDLVAKYGMPPLRPVLPVLLEGP